MLKGSAATDHNSILVDLVITGLQKTKPEKITKWRLNAPEKKWEVLSHELQQCAKTIPHIINRNMNDMNLIFENWTQMVERKALQCIGKTTTKPQSAHADSIIIKNIRKEKREAKHAFQNEREPKQKRELQQAYITKQAELRQQIKYEQNMKVNLKFEKMINQGSRGFWHEMKNLKRDEMARLTCIKNDGIRIYDPELQKETVAEYYENLYSFDKNMENHPHHAYVTEKIIEYENNREHESLW